MSGKQPLRDWARNLVPPFLLKMYRNRKKQQTRTAIKKQKEAGEGMDREQLSAQLRKMGIKAGDVLLVHAALSKIGYVKGGAPTLVHALFDVLGPEGHLLMPTSPNPALQLDHMRSCPTFDVCNSPSKMGSVSEYFRKMRGVERSLHPTEPVSVSGPDASWFIKDHLGEITPYTNQSPWYRVSEKKGKILYIGVTLINAGTSLHTLEDAVDFPYPVYFEEAFAATIVDKNGAQHRVKTKVHNPVMSAKRKCDELIPMFKEKGVAQPTQLGNAPCLLLDAHRMFHVMIEAFTKHGITMYTPNGETLKL